MRLSELMKIPNEKITIGIGAVEGSRKVIEKSIMRARKVAKVDCKVIDNEEMLVNLLFKKEIDCAIRGTLPSSKLIPLLRKRTNKKILRAALLEDAYKRAFILAPVGIDEGNCISEKKKFIKLCNDFMTLFGIKPKVAILSKGRLEDCSRGRDISNSIAQGNSLVKFAKINRISAKHYGILLEDALKKSNCIIAPDGVSGNLIFRAIHYAGMGSALGAVALDLLPSSIYIDTSRAKSDYSDSILFCASIANVLQRAALFAHS
ncbi:MAG: methanogenesis marker protein Mmp4/MtxX [Thermoplasmata archaeon]